jgi:hypothetical protein
MSISLGIYDLFANAIPGLFYLFVFNEIAKVYGVTPIDWTSIDNLGGIILVGLVAYVVGHIMDFISYRLWFRVFNKKRHWEVGYENFVNNYPELKTKFNPTQVSLLLNIIRYENLEVTNEIERDKVISIMLRNVSFASILFALLELFLTFWHGFSLPDLLAVILAVIVSYAAFRRSNHFNIRYYEQVYEYAAIRGKDILEVLKNVKSAKKG